jgi:hypothetical protein
VVTRSAEEILEFVMGVDSYHRADHKIGRVRSLRRDGEGVIASFWGRATRVPSAAATALLSVIGDVRVS